MDSHESKALSDEGYAASDLPDFPVIQEVPHEPWPLAMTWSEAVRSFAPFRDYYMSHFDSAEQRLADKNPEPFVLD